MRRRRARRKQQRQLAAAGGALAAIGGLFTAWRATGARTAVQKAISARKGKQDDGAAPDRAADATAEHHSTEGSGQTGKDDSGPQSWHCECGQGYLVSGQDRHQIYWYEDADQSDAILGGHCPECDRPLPVVPRVNAGD